MPKLHFDDSNIYYKTLGSGVPIIFLHNGFYSSKTWHSVMMGFSKNYKVIVYDRVGYGKSTHWQDNLSGNIIDIGVVELERLVDTLKLEKFHLVGHCLGGAIALSYALKHPSKVDKIVAEAVGYYGDYKSLVKTDWTFRPYDEISIDLQQDLIKMHGKEYAEVFWEMLCKYHSGYIMSEDYDIRDEIRKLANTLLIMNGDRDFFFDVSVPVEVYKKMRNSKLWIVPNCGHDIHVEYKREFVEVVTRFLRDE